MAFRDTDMSAGDAGRMASRWVREFLLEDWGLKLLALAITLILWFAVTGQRAPATVVLRRVALEYMRPSEIEISNEPIREVNITIEGGRGRLDEIKADNLVARVDIGQLSPGERILRLSRDNVTVQLPSGVQPEGVQVVRVEPGSVALTLERSVERELEVEVLLDGRPAEGFEVRAARATPSRVKVRGPESHVEALTRAFTDTIRLDGQRESVDREQVAVVVPDPKIVLPETQTVNVRVEVAEVREERRVAGVAVRSASGAPVSPQGAAVTVEGPRSLVERLRAEELSLVVEQGADGATRARLVLPPGLEGRVVLVGTTPSEFTIQR